jgi:hypothetical protein
MACAADIVGAAMARTMDGQDYEKFIIVFRPGLPRSSLPQLEPSLACGEQVRIYGVRYATLVEDEDPPKFQEGTFLTE